MSESEQSPAAAGDEPAVDLTNIEPCFHSVVREHGKEMFLLVMSGGMANQAFKRLGALVNKHQSRGGHGAISTLMNAYNSISLAYMADHKWTPGQLAQCERDIQIAWNLRNGDGSGKSNILVLQ